MTSKCSLLCPNRDDDDHSSSKVENVSKQKEEGGSEVSRATLKLFDFICVSHTLHTNCLFTVGQSHSQSAKSNLVGKKPLRILAESRKNSRSKEMVINGFLVGNKVANM